MPDVIKVALVEDRKPTREGLEALLSATDGCRTVGAWASMEQALARIDWEPPDVLLADIELPGMSGIEGVRRLKAKYPALQILMLTVYSDNDSVFEAICAGASGYLLKDTPPSRLVEAIREAATGGAPMTPSIAKKVVTMFQSVAVPRTDDAGLTARELDVLQLLAEGHSYRSAADAAGISLDTLRFHVRNIYEKLHVHSKSDAVLKAMRAGIVK